MGVRETPASIGQRLVWLLDHYRLQSGILNCPLVFRIRGRLDTGRLAAALGDLTARHESLRTTFTGRGPRLTQLIHDPRPLPLTVTGLPGPDREQAVRSALTQELRTPVDAAGWPVRATLWQAGDNEHVLCLNMHHLVTDAWSCGLLFRELGLLLDQRHGGTAELQPDAWQYAQFAQWQRDRVEGDALQPHRAYWQQRLAGARLPGLPLSDIPAGTTLRWSSERGGIDSGAAGALRKIARAERTTIFSVMLALYYLLLYHRTGQADLTVTSLFANRTRREVQGTVGFIANMVLLRTLLRPGAGFASLVRETHATVIGALAHQELPFQMLPSGTLGSGAGRPNDVVFQMLAEPIQQRATAAGNELEGMIPEVPGRFGVEFALVPAAGGFTALLFFTEDRLDRDWARQLVAGYSRLATAVAASPGRPLSEFSV